MKYKSELIKDIVDSRGHEKSSIHYESECVEKWIEEAKGGYPKLCDYESEWLNYINENPIGNFPYETVTANPPATINNVVPYEYKSAILKGNTLVNLVNDITSNEVGNYSNSLCKINIIRNLQNETLTIIFNVTSLEIPDGADGIMRIGGGWSGQIRHKPTLGVNKVLYNYNQTSNSWLGVYSNSSAYNLGQRITISDVMVLEGDYTNIDIPYFEGMQSVKMPVLITTGKNIAGNLEQGSIGANGENVNNANDSLYTRTGFILLKKDTVYSFSLNGSKRSYHLFLYDLNKNFKQKIGMKNGYTPEVNCYIRLFQMDNINKALYQVEEGTIATPYEACQSNILTVNEDVTLRSNGDICDELNLLTAQLTKRIGDDGVVLSQEVVKTVDLSIQDQDGNTLRKIKPIEGTMHITALGTPINPTGTFEVPVEAITQNLNSFIEEE